MSGYSKAQEYRLKRYFEKHPRCELLKYYGSREAHKGDFLVECDDVLLRVDHKSTTHEYQMSLQSDWMPKLLGYCSMAEDGSIPVITMSFKNCHNLYAMYYWKEEYNQTMHTVLGAVCFEKKSTKVLLQHMDSACAIKDHYLPAYYIESWPSYGLCINKLGHFLDDIHLLGGVTTS